MTTKAAFITAMGGALLPFGSKITFARSAGDVFTATAHGLETGAGPYKVTTSNADAPAGLIVARHASTFMTGVSMIATDVLEVDGKNYTLIATPAADGDVDVGANDTETVANIAAAINQDRDAGATSYHEDTVPLDSVHARVTAAGVLTLLAASLDAAIGNAITCSSVDSTMTVDNATLQNGASGTDYYIIRLSANTFSLATTKALAIAGTAVTITDAGTGVHKLVPTVQTLADALENVLVGHLTSPGLRVFNRAFNIAKFWTAAVSGATTGDT
jgi:hypothetical protein